MVVVAQNGFIREKWLYSGKVVVFGQKCLYSGKSGCILAKLLYSDKSGCIQAKVDVFGKAVVLGQ